jgi:hypothetical protein
MHIECTLDNDPRLIAGVGALIAQAGRYMGLTQHDGEGVAIAAMQACREAFAQAQPQGAGTSPGSRTDRGKARAPATMATGRPLEGKQAAGRPAIRLIVSDLQDHIEVTVEYAGKALPEARQNLLRKSTESVAREGGDSLRQHAHAEVRFDASEGRCRVTLSKHCGAVKASLKS